ncbi:hypothetical protein FRD01_23750 [Microvenator marinus]|uniref:Uncharacterized protein n=1 Tax=Microvenator marinus TaxID=2600177 RepID=A0A5B8XWA6_9DELT|nr:hypothetical protein [Microvenator marinus]QED30192.1 hypothetical protein FRD01_23750 [Microvenator marinus]
MATKKPAKIASAKKGKGWVRTCPACNSDMAMAKILRVEASSGMFWLCSNASCNTLVTSAGANAGVLDLK